MNETYYPLIIIDFFSVNNFLWFSDKKLLIEENSILNSII